MQRKRMNGENKIEEKKREKTQIDRDRDRGE